MERQLQSTTLRIHGVNDETFFLLFDWWPSQQTGFPKSKRATKLTKTTNLSAMSHPSRMSHGALLSTLQIDNKKSLRNLLFFDFTMWRPLICAAPCREPHQPILRKKKPHYYLHSHQTDFRSTSLGHLSDRPGEPWAARRPRLHPLPRRPVGGPGVGENHPEISGAEQQRGTVVLLLPRREQPQPLQAAVQEPHEQRGADRGGEGGRAGGGGGSFRAEHPGERTRFRVRGQWPPGESALNPLHVSRNRNWNCRFAEQACWNLAIWPKHVFFSSSSPYQVFDDLQKMLSIATETDQSRSDVGAARFTASPVLQLAVGLCVALATVGAAMYGM